MHIKKSWPRKVFVVFNSCFIALTCIICIYPILNTLAVSFSSREAVAAGRVNLLPVDFQLDAYRFVMEEPKFVRGFLISVERVILGVLINMALTILAAYPLSKTRRQFPKRNIYMWAYIFTMLFAGGMIPAYMVVKTTGLIDTIWALILPGAVPVYYVILLQNYFKSLPDELYDAARIDGAGEWRILYRIFLPLSKPILATLIVYNTVNHWNAWFDGMLYMNRPEHFPLQTYLQTIVVELDLSTINDISQVMNISTQNSKAAQIIIAMVPILCVYPFLQKYFTKGIVMGSVKG